MLLSDIRTHVRTTLDLDATELTDTMLDVWCREGSDEILARSRIWPSFEAAWTFPTVSGTQSYVISVIEPVSTDTAEILTIVDAASGGFPLEPVAHELAERTWRNSLLTSGLPMYWSQWAGSVYLWPKPNVVHTMNVRSYRLPNDWVAVGAAATPDMDTRLQSAVALWCLVRAYEWQEEPQMASVYRDLFEGHVTRVMREIFRAPHRQTILNRGTPNASYLAWMQSLGKITWP